MKKLTLSALSLTAMMGISQATMAQTIYVIVPDMTTHHKNCRPAKDSYQLCEYTNKETGKIDFVAGQDSQGNDVYMTGYQNGKVNFKATYEYKNGMPIKTSIYDAQGNLVKVEKKVNAKTHNREIELYQNGQLFRIEHYRNSHKLYSQDYQNKQKHGKEFHYADLVDDSKNVVIYEANWANGVKHGEEKFYKERYGETKLKKTVIWQNGKPMS